MIKRRPDIMINDIPVYGDVILAPMAGFSDIPHRKICRKFGAAMSYSEFVSAKEVLTNQPRAFSALDFTEEDRPMVFQLFGNDPLQILRAAQEVEHLKPDVIDINLGCSTRRVSGRGSGVAMMREPKTVEKILRLLTQHLSLPITAKIRLGWTDRMNYLEIGKILEDNGAALVAIHPRTKEQGYKGKANWRAIAELKNALSIPIVGNGDVVEAGDIQRMKRETGCDGVMIGRGAIGNPWIFRRQSKRALTFAQLASIVREHLQEMIAYYGDHGLILFRKYVKRYFRGLGILRDDLQRLIRAENANDFFESLTFWEGQFGSICINELGDF